MSPRFAPSELFLKAQTDERLLALSGQGHGRAFAVMVERRRGALLAHAQRMVGRERAEDVLQQTLLRAWSSLQSGLEVRHAQAWLHRIVHNASLNEIERRVQGTEPLDEQLAGRGSVIVDAERRFEARQVLQGLASLPERQRLALLGTELEGRSRRELAAELGLSEGAVRQLVHRARAGVRAAVAAVVPLPLLTRLMKGAGWLPGPETGGGLRSSVEAVTASSLLAGGAAKAGGALLAIGAVGGGLLLHGAGGRPHGPASAVAIPHQFVHAGGPRHVRLGTLLAFADAGGTGTPPALRLAPAPAVRRGSARPAASSLGTSSSLRQGASVAPGRREAAGGARTGNDRSSLGESSQEPQRAPSREPGSSVSSGTQSGSDSGTGTDGGSEPTAAQAAATPQSQTSALEDGASSSGEVSTAATSERSLTRAGGSSAGATGTGGDTPSASAPAATSTTSTQAPAAPSE